MNRRIVDAREVTVSSMGKRTVAALTLINLVEGQLLTSVAAAALNLMNPKEGFSPLPDAVLQSLMLQLWI